MPLDEWKPRRSGSLTSEGMGLKTRKQIEVHFSLWVAQDDVQDELRECAKQLVQHRRAMREQPEWGHFATCVEYRCKVLGCEDNRSFRSQKSYANTS